MSQHSTPSRGSVSNFYPRTTPSSSRSTSGAGSTGTSSSSGRSSDSTPLSSRETTQQLISGVAACQKSIEELLQTLRRSNERIEELADKVKTLDNKVDKLSDTTEEINADGRGKKRKRTKSSLLVQEEVHKFHNSRDPERQYKGMESVTSRHNTWVTQLIVDELCRQDGFTKTVVQRTAKKYHEHLRRTALGKITDEVKRKNKKNLRKERKYERRRGLVNGDRESRAFSALTKEHMSSDEDDLEAEEEGGWVSRPPSYRSRTISVFLIKLDKRGEKAEKNSNKRWKRTQIRVGEPVDKEPPVATPKWALSDEWREIILRREQEQTEGAGRENGDEPEETRGEEESDNDEDESDSSSSGNELNFENDE